MNMSKTPIPKDWIRSPGLISPESDELLRSKARRKGDLSRLLDDAVKQTYRPKETVVPTLPDNPTTT